MRVEVWVAEHYSTKFVVEIPDDTPGGDVEVRATEEATSGEYDYDRSDCVLFAVEEINILGK